MGNKAAGLYLKGSAAKELHRLLYNPSEVEVEEWRKILEEIEAEGNLVKTENGYALNLKNFNFSFLDSFEDYKNVNSSDEKEVSVFFDTSSIVLNYNTVMDVAFKINICEFFENLEDKNLHTELDLRIKDGFYKKQVNRFSGSAA